jgi:hypothetical protein
MVDSMTDGYWFTFDRSAYDGWRDGTPFTLPELWREVRGMAGVTISAPTGRVVLANAGSLAARWEHIHRAKRTHRNARVCTLHLAVTHRKESAP